MAYRNRVSKLVRVKQGGVTFEFEILDDNLLIEVIGRQDQAVRFILKEPALNALKELLGPNPRPVPVGPDEPPGERPPGSVPTEGHPEGKPATEKGQEGLQRQADGVVEGMG